MEFDYIIVGAGTAGCVMAARLSERASCRVLLIEAGADIVPEPESIRNPYPISHGVPAFRWPNMMATIKAPLTPGAPTQPSPFPQARVVGGGGSLMGMFALRGLPADYDEWRDSGAAGWGWSDVLPRFRRLERDLDFDGEAHGRDGPIPIRRHARENWSPLARALGDAFEADGFPFIADPNADFRDGHVSMPSSSLPDRRMSSAAGYLNAETRARRNLTVLAESEAKRVVFDGRRATGVVVATPSGDISYAARKVVICAGALKSPQILLESGIGAGVELRAVGVEPVHDLPGVGRNLCNHPIVYVAALVPPKYRRPGGPAIFSALRYSSELPDCPAQDMVLPLLNRTAWHAMGECTSLLGASVYKPASRGRVSLTRSGDGVTSNINLAFFSDARDLARLADGFKRVVKYLARASEAMPGVKLFAPTSTSLMNRLAEPRMLHGAMASVLTAMLDSPLQDRMLKRAGDDPLAIAPDEERLLEFVYRHSSPMFHPAGTCRIGATDDPAAVVDPRCRVIGVDGLYVADASVMPSIVRANTNIPTIMIAEKVAEMLREDETHD